MQGNAVYLLAAGIVFVVVVALLLVWTSRQLRKHGQNSGLATRERPASAVVREVSGASGERDAQVETADVSAAVVESQTDITTWAAPLEPSLPPEAVDMHEAQTQNAFPSGEEVMATELSAVSSGPSRSASELVGPEEFSAHFPALVFSFVEDEKHDLPGPDDGATAQTQVAAAGAGGSAASVTPEPALSAAPEEPPAASEHKEMEGGLADRLREAMKHPAVLGWLLIGQDGVSPASDQVYDEEVISMLEALAGQAERTAETVGLSHAREFAVRGVEGMIYLIPVRRLGVDRDGYAVAFVEEDRLTATDLARMLGAHDTDESVSGPGQ